MASLTTSARVKASTIDAWARPPSQALAEPPPGDPQRSLMLIDKVQVKNTVPGDGSDRQRTDTLGRHRKKIAGLQRRYSAGEASCYAIALCAAMPTLIAVASYSAAKLHSFSLKIVALFHICLLIICLLI